MKYCAGVYNYKNLIVVKKIKHTTQINKPTLPCGYLKGKGFDGVGKGRKVKFVTRSESFIKSWRDGNEDKTIEWYSGNFRTNLLSTNNERHGPSRKCVKKARRRSRHKTKKMAVSFNKEVNAEKEDNEFAKKKLIKIHKAELRVLRQKFFRDIYALWEKQSIEMHELENI